CAGPRRRTLGRRRPEREHRRGPRRTPAAQHGVAGALDPRPVERRDSSTGASRNGRGLGKRGPGRPLPGARVIARPGRHPCRSKIGADRTPDPTPYPCREIEMKGSPKPPPPPSARRAEPGKPTSVRQLTADAQATPPAAAVEPRSEERRVGKEGRVQVTT